MGYNEKMMRVVAIAMLVLGAGCSKKDPQVVTPSDANDGDFGETSLLIAIEKASAGRNDPAVIARFAEEVRVLTPEFNAYTAEIAERNLVFLALAPMDAKAGADIGARVRALSSTVWPIALYASPRADETAAEYFERLCGGELATECRRLVPEVWPEVVEAVVWRRLKERARRAYANCDICREDPSFRKILDRYDYHQTAVSARAGIFRRHGDRMRWPIAGENAGVWPVDLPELSLRRLGLFEIDGVRMGKMWRRVILEKRGGRRVLGVHVEPSRAVDDLDSVLSAARTAGYSRVVLAARDSEFPYRLRGYEVSVKRPLARQAGVQPSDSVQLLIRALDHSAGEVGRKKQGLSRSDG